MYTELLAELAQNKHMMLILKSDAPHMRMKDRELILRFFAMSRSTPYHFVSPVKSWCALWPAPAVGLGGLTRRAPVTNNAPLMVLNGYLRGAVLLHRRLLLGFRQEVGVAGHGKC